MSKSKVVALLALAGAAILLTSLAAAQTGAQVTAGDGDSGSNSTSQSVTTEGGNVTNTNVTVTSVTQKWAAFYGQLNGQDVLSDSSSNNFYEWTVSDPTGSVVYAVPSGQGSPNTVSTVGTPSTLLSSSEFTTGVDNVDDTFNSTEDVSGDGSTAAAHTFSSGSPDTSLSTGLYDDGGNPVYAAEVQNGVAGFDGNSYDFQLLVGVGEQTDTQTYDFYAELN
jgi:hypothetical protein